jgi:hypothetical protein
VPRRWYLLDLQHHLDRRRRAGGDPREPPALRSDATPGVRAPHARGPRARQRGHAGGIGCGCRPGGALDRPRDRLHGGHLPAPRADAESCPRRLVAARDRRGRCRGGTLRLRLRGAPRSLSRPAGRHAALGGDAGDAPRAARPSRGVGTPRRGGHLDTRRRGGHTVDPVGQRRLDIVERVGLRHRDSDRRLVRRPAPACPASLLRCGRPRGRREPPYGADANRRHRRGDRARAHARRHGGVRDAQLPGLRRLLLCRWRAPSRRPRRQRGRDGRRVAGDPPRARGGVGTRNDPRCGDGAADATALRTDLRGYSHRVDRPR